MVAWGVALKLDKWIQVGRAVLGARLLGRRTPLVASLSVTARCNLDCAYCDRSARLQKELPASRWRSILDELTDLGCVRISLTGGEPLLRPDLGQILDHALSLGLGVVLNTNGHLVGKNLDLVSRFHGVTTSLDGPAEVHDTLRVPGSHDLVVDACREVRARSIPVTLYTVMSEENLGHMDYVLATAAEIGCDVIFQPGTRHGFFSGAPNPSTPSPRRYRRAIDHLIDRARQGAPVGNSTAGLRYLRNWPDPAPIPCLGDLLFCRIEPDGGVRICGRDHLGDGSVSVAGSPVADALARLTRPGCESCWSAARVEFHLLTRGRPSALWWLARRRFASWNA